jgi:hypothetical protein
MVREPVAAVNTRSETDLAWRRDGRPGQHTLLATVITFRDREVILAFTCIASHYVHFFEVQNFEVVGIYPATVRAGDADSGKGRRFVKIHDASRICGGVAHASVRRT